MSTSKTFAGILFALSSALCLVGTASADTLGVTKTGTGSGTVTSNVGTISCGNDCTDDFPNATSITLTAAPEAGSQFTGWLGPCTGTGPCTFAIDGPTGVEATFAPLAIGLPTLDVDATTTCDPFTDGLLMMRYLFGLSNDALIAQAVGDGAGRSSAQQIASYLDNIKPFLDVDGNGQADALTDGLLLFRYLAGLRGESLITGAVGIGAQRDTAEEIVSALDSRCVAVVVVPPDPATVAPPVDQTIATTLGSATGFLYTGPNPVQTGVAPGTIEARRAAVLRGTVHTRDGPALTGVKITILNHLELGQTFSRADGAFDLAVNGGGMLTVNYQKTGFLPVQRQLNVPWQDYAIVPDVVMIAVDPQVTPITPNAGAMQVAQGSTMSDADGTRRARLLVPAGTTANLVLANGTLQPVGTLNVRATEYTVGVNGPKAMPAVLPPTSGYTYAVELSADEAIAAGAQRVEFSQPLFSYVENFLGFPVGGAVPAGYYDRVKAAWIPSANGRVIKITAINGGIADVDSVGAGALPVLTLSTAERQQLASLYSVGQQLWRVPVTHFTPWDYNWPYGPPDDATAPDVPAPDGDDPQDCSTESPGSIIECENQALGERVRVVGTPYTLNYRSSRVPGRTAARALKIHLSGPSVPGSLKRIELHVQFAGKVVEQNFAAAPDQQTEVTWDGLDVYGRSLQGNQPVTATIGYVYDVIYRKPAQFAASFGAFGTAALAGNGSRTEITISRSFRTTIGGLDVRGIGLGGWSLSSHHFYDANAQMLHLGNGSRRSANSLANGITTVAGNGQFSFSGDGGQARLASMKWPWGIALGPDGSMYIGDYFDRRVRRVGPNGVITTVAGNGSSSATGDGGLATAASIGEPAGVALGPDGSLYIADQFNPRIRRVGPDGLITTVAGTDTAGFGGDGGPATQAQLRDPMDVAVGPDGSLYIADFDDHRIRRVAPDGIITTVAGNGVGGFSGDGGPATLASIKDPYGVAIGPDGSLYIADWSNSRIRRVGTDGIIRTVAGDGFQSFSGDGGQATSASLNHPTRVSFGADGSLYIADTNNNRIRRVGPDGIITTVAGNGIEGFSGGGGPANQASLSIPIGIAVAPDGSLLVADRNNGRARRISPILPGFSEGDLVIAADDANELYVFNGTGRHLRTVNSLTGASLLEFAYDAAGRLTHITQKTGDIDNVTVIQRDAAGKPGAIVAPFGQSTALGLDTNGFLASITNPAGEQVQFVSTTSGLLLSLTDPRGKKSLFSYDTVGRLSLDADPAGGSQALARSGIPGQFTVTRTTALARTTTHNVESLPGAITKATITFPDGTQAASETTLDAGVTVVTTSDGTITNLKLSPDPRFGMQSPAAVSRSIAVLDGPTLTSTNSRTAILTDPVDPLSMTSLTSTATIDGRTSTITYTSATKTRTTTTPTGRTSTLTIDALGRTIQSQSGSLAPFAHTYDSRGRLASSTRGSGPTSRTFLFAYNPQGFLDTITDPIGRTAHFNYDSAGRILSKTLPDGRVASFGYDAASNMTSLTPPGRPTHTFAYSDRDEVILVTPPTIPGTGSTSYSYSLDSEPTVTQKSDGRTVTIGYDAGGRVASRTLATGGITTGVDLMSYDAAGRLTGIAAASGMTTTYTYAGRLLTGKSWAGPVSGSVSHTYDSSFRLATESINDANTHSLSYDSDDLLIGAGDLAIARDAQNGLPTGSTLGVVATSLAFNGFGELVSYDATASGNPLFTNTFNRDGLGRISQKSETIGGVVNSYSYNYDAAGRLIVASKNGMAVETYGYDQNSNRTSATVGGSSVIAVYDSQDRLVEYGATTYVYNGAGNLVTKSNGAGTTTYQYDQLGNLLGVTLPDGKSVSYIVDGNNRRVGKKVNGTLIAGYLYRDSLRLIAELDGTGTLVSRFIHAGSNVPVAMIKGGNTFRIVTDQLGSVRLVINAATGSIAQRLDYDSFGNVILDSNPGFQPFGFAGGHYDTDSRLVRFGTRDYDAEVGRWTAKDRIQFAGGDTNLYSYSGQDPMNRRDPLGLDDEPSVVVPIIQSVADVGNTLGRVSGGPDMGSGDRAAGAGCALADYLVPGSCPLASENRRRVPRVPFDQCPGPRCTRPPAPDFGSYSDITEDPLLNGSSEDPLLSGMSMGQPESSPAVTPIRRPIRRQQPLTPGLGDPRCGTPGRGDGLPYI